MPIILAIVPGSQVQIKNIKQSCDMEVTFEYQRKKRRIGQCYNFQRFGHSAYNYKAEPVCRHCAGCHESRAHNKDDVGPNKCGNCKGPHKANYHGCPDFPTKEKKDPPLFKRTRPLIHARDDGNSENSNLHELISAMDKLRELITRRPILVGVIQLKSCQGAQTPPSRDWTLLPLTSTSKLHLELQHKLVSTLVGHIVHNFSYT
ncbi:hypothetical protein JTB14_036507 [Gonioctena quinquepunctata]|nr:hypothetical protein JTB14_036507 [Gonioctena quinquepunctata]